MPCDSSYLDASKAESNSRLIAKHLMWLAGKLQIPLPIWVRKAAQDYYGNTSKIDEMTRLLCSMCKDPRADALIYNSRNRNARALADWWEDHQEADRRREEEANTDLLRRQALQKLTPEEKEALGL